MRTRWIVLVLVCLALWTVRDQWRPSLALGQGPGSTPPILQGVLVTPDPLLRRGAAKIVVTVTAGTNPSSQGLEVILDLSALGGLPSTPLSDAGGAACDEAAGDRAFTVCFIIPPAVPAGPVVLQGVVRDAQGRSSPISISTAVATDADGDSDGLTDRCETSFGLNPSASAGPDGAAGDPDGDNLTNAQECDAGTHPRGLFSRYFAEGVSNAFFSTRLTLFNPSLSTVTALVRVQPEGSAERAVLVSVPGFTRRTLLPDDLKTVTGAPFAALVESDGEIVVDRLVSWGANTYGSHAETAVKAPATTWYLAEGATGWRFSLFYLLQNPTSNEAQVQVSYLRGANEPVLMRTYRVGPRQRRTIFVDDEQFPEGSGITPLAATDVSAIVTSINDVPIVVERSMYMSPDGQPFGAGHAGAGVTAPSTDWFFAEGATGDFFDEFILVANPGNDMTTVTVTYSPEGRASLERPYDVAPHSRRTIWVDEDPDLNGTAVSARLHANVPIVAERAMWWPGSGESWREAHVSAGAVSAGPRWAVADLEVGGPFNADSYVLVYNGGTLTVYFDDGSTAVTCGTAGPGRVTFRINDCPGVAGKRFVSAVVEGTAQTVVERAVYFSTTSTFAAGGAALATQLPATATSTTAIPTSGGIAALPQVGTVGFPSGSFPIGSQVALSATASPETHDDFTTTTVLFSTLERLSYELRIVTGTIRPSLDTTVTMRIPDLFRQQLPANGEIQAFAQFFQDGGEEDLDQFELIASLVSGDSITFVLPPEAFTDLRRDDGFFEAIVTLASTPTKPPAAAMAMSSSVPSTHRIVAPSGLAPATPGTCEGASLGAPLASMTVTSAFNGKTHYGTDLRAADGTPVRAMADGWLENYGYQVKPLKKPNARSGKMIRGWGYFIVIRHKDGSKTLYAHLQPGPPPIPIGGEVKKGDVIATSDDSGGSEAPHLHVEYAPNGLIYENPSKVDTGACIGGNVTGSITVADNGSAADDAFTVAINGLTVCQTSIGATNTCAVGNLRSGTATLTITANIAPDDIGTFGITLANGLRFQGGGTSVSGVIPRGGTESFIITIPAPSP
jgi:murein DD-endopeptidase MepM/ murein hydrolase activator NlpD